MPFEDELPDDIDLWPTDPLALIGTTSDASRKELKRAYTKRIRRFKPEHFPEQFRRLREAYDSLDRQFEWRELLEKQSPELIDPSEKSESSDEDLSEETPLNGIDSPPSDHSRFRSDDVDAGEIASTDLSHVRTPRQPSVGPDTDQLWQQLLDGCDSGFVYGKLRDLGAQSKLSELGYVQLYWMLTLDPLLNRGRDPCSWLIEGVRHHGLSRQLQSILMIEARRRSGEVPLLLTEELLDQFQSASQVVEFVQLRWYVARRIWRFDVIKKDFDQVRDRLIDEPNKWAALLHAAVCQLVLVPSDTAGTILVTVCEELEKSLNGFEFSWLWDWYDSTIILHNSWILSTHSDYCISKMTTIQSVDLYGQPMTSVHGDTLETRALLQRLSNLTAFAWDRSTYQIREEIQAFCFALAKDPEESLKHLLAINQVVRPLLGHLLQLIQEQLSHSNADSDYRLNEGAEREIKAFIFRKLWAYKRWETTILKFCWKAAVTPNEIAATMEEFADQLPDCVAELIGSIRSHLPLQCLVLAQRVVWPSS